MKHIRCRWMKINAVAMTKPDQSGISVCGRVSTAARLLKGKRVEVNQQVKSHDYSAPVLSTHTHTRGGVTPFSSNKTDMCNEI